MLAQLKRCHVGRSDRVAHNVIFNAARLCDRSAVLRVGGQLRPHGFAALCKPVRRGGPRAAALADSVAAAARHCQVRLVFFFFFFFFFFFLHSCHRRRSSRTSSAAAASGGGSAASEVVLMLEPTGAETHDSPLVGGECTTALSSALHCGPTVPTAPCVLSAFPAPSLRSLLCVFPRC